MVGSSSSSSSDASWRRNKRCVTERFGECVEFPLGGGTAGGGGPGRTLRLGQGLVDPDEEGWMTEGDCPTVWDASAVLADYLLARAGELQLSGRRVVEIGSGCGLAGLVAASLGADVTLTDLEPVLPVLRSNAEAAAETLGLPAPPAVRPLRWGEHHLQPWWDAPWDVVIGSDIGYAPQDQDALVATLAAACGPDTVLLLCNERRWKDIEGWLAEELETRFARTVVPKAEHGPRFTGEEFDIFRCTLLPPEDDGEEDC